jgi:hypothetical protein
LDRVSPNAPAAMSRKSEQAASPGASLGVTVGHGIDGSLDR